MKPDSLIFAGDVLIRFRNGRILIHTTQSSLPAFETEHPMLIGWLCQFARPTRAEQALAGLPAADRTTASEVLDYLQRAGSLIERGRCHGTDE